LVRNYFKFTLDYLHPVLFVVQFVFECTHLLFFTCSCLFHIFIDLLFLQNLMLFALLTFCLSNEFSVLRDLNLLVKSSMPAKLSLSPLLSETTYSRKLVNILWRFNSSSLSFCTLCLSLSFYLSLSISLCLFIISCFSLESLSSSFLRFREFY
jgi:hypothetical protein